MSWLGFLSSNQNTHPFRARPPSTAQVTADLDLTELHQPLLPCRAEHSTQPDIFDDPLWEAMLEDESIDIDKRPSFAGAGHPNVVENYHGPDGFIHNDQQDMDRMGKIQELRRDFRTLSAIAFTVILQGTWEVLLVATYQGLSDGGLAGLFWSYIWTFTGMSFVVASLAEMASMAPTSGGQYHWVSEFAPVEHQRFLSYLTGWMSTLSWQAGTASGPFLVGTMIQALVSANDDTYEGTRWQGTLLVFAVTAIVYVLNVWGAKAMPMMQNFMLVVHIVGFVTIIVTLWVLSLRNSAEMVFTQFYNGGGWSSTGLCLMVGQISAIYACICSDAAAHMSEETEDAGAAVPHAMVWSYILNGALGLVFLITYLFCLTDLEAALELDYPFLLVFQKALRPAGVNALTALVLVLIFAGTVGFNLSTSRQTWAFARDHGLPYSAWIARVHPTRHVPVNAIAVTCGITILLSLINIGSDVAFNAIISLNVVSLMITYTISIGCVMWRRIALPETLPYARWSLGRWGVLVNAVALSYSLFAFFWCFWPNSTPVDLETFNWAVVMFLGVFVVCMIYYFVRGRQVYKGPVVLVEGRRDH